MTQNATSPAPKTGEEFYRETVFLPKTDFPLRGNLAEREPVFVQKWKDMDLYARLRAQSRGREKYILHIGPPYANGAMHLGHAVNNTLKDVINKSWQMMGYDAPMVMGWDCHGLPIEWKIEEKYRNEGRDKDAVDPVTFRAECRAFAKHWVEVQSNDLQRIGVVGDFKDPYLTMSNHAESRIAGVIHHFAKNGGLYRGVKPVMWSVVEKTALAEAEVEYKEHKSITVWIKFPVIRNGPSLVPENTSIVIWTTTPWTLPSNRGIAFGPDITYGIYRVDGIADDSRAKVGEHLILADKLSGDVFEKAKITGATRLDINLTAPDLECLVCAHPLRGAGYEFDVRVLNADFVTDDTGTGFVHIAPSHGEDDFYLGKKSGLEITDNLDDAGVFRAHVPLFAGKSVYTEKGELGDANFAVIKAMDEVGGLLAKGTVKHDYPHSWRSKAPLIFRTTPQWFISMDQNELRKKALEGIANTKWHPSIGANRIGSMIEHRPDWCISRQRLWGVPVAIFVNRKTGTILNDDAVNSRITDLFEKEGADAWWSHPASDFLGVSYNPDDYEMVMDTADVWLDSGSTHTFVLRDRPELKFPADLYLEGSDQHRGWFHTSLLISCGINGVAPYKNVLTHGFIMDEKGYKMSKSLGNGIEPQEIMNQYGADILRLWAMTSDYTEDVRLGKTVLNTIADMYRRIRNTIRFLLGAMDGITDGECLSNDELARAPELERLVLHWIAEMDAKIRADIENYNYNDLIDRLHHFCAFDLSAFYFDVRKDRLYCDRSDLFERRATRTVMMILFEHLVKWLAPILSFTTEEAWGARPAILAPGVPSVHLTTFPVVSPAWRDDVLAQKWARVRDIRRVVTGAIEPYRGNKTIGSSLEAAPVIYISPDRAGDIDGLDMAEICITSQATVVMGPTPDSASTFTLADVPGVAVMFAVAKGQKCARCWKVLETVGSDPDYPDLSPRDADAVRHYVTQNKG